MLLVLGFIVVAVLTKIIWVAFSKKVQARWALYWFKQECYTALPRLLVSETEASK